MLSVSFHPKNGQKFRYDIESIHSDLSLYNNQVEYIRGMLLAVPPEKELQLIMNIMVADTVSCLEFEGDYLENDIILSAFQNLLGMTSSFSMEFDLALAAAVIIIMARESYKEPISVEMMMTWYSLLNGNIGVHRLGEWRTSTDPMQVVYGARLPTKSKRFSHLDKTAPPELTQFVRWFNDTGPGGFYDIFHPVVRSALTYLYFDLIRPLDTGNRMIGLCLAEKALAQGLGRPLFFSLSKSIMNTGSTVYAQLAIARRSEEITPWIRFYVETVLEAIKVSANDIEFGLMKLKLLNKCDSQLNARQSKILQLMLENGPIEYPGGMSARKYARLTGVSKATATRDIQHLLSLEAFKSQGSGRSTIYQIDL